MSTQTGKIGVTSENIFPVIKKFLYSDQEIFLRELVSNAVDATQKMKTLASTGEAKGELGDLTIHVTLDPESRTLTVSDHGIGMTADEIDKYINQIAFSSAEEFLEKYQNQNIIGHFGLGFYSAFMVADKVEIVTRSYKKGAKTMHWSCDGTPEYTMDEASEERPTRGTDIILHLSEESKEYAEPERIRGILKKYCAFLPVPIAFGKEQEWKDGKMVDTDRDEISNDTEPLWMKKPSEITDEEYVAFYRKLYPGSEDPLFYIHLNIDYPFTLTGILYFPKIRNNFEIQKNKIQLYSNQVFVTDSVEGIVPEFLTLLNGVIDSPDIPLNVSRSYLQGDPNVRKISSYITRKVAERLGEIFTNQRAEYESKWDDLKIFIEYGILTDEKFAEKATDFVLLKNVEGKYFTIDEYAAAVKENQTDRNDNVVYLYTNDKVAQHSFIQTAEARGYDVLEMNGQLDSAFIGWMEQKYPGTRFARVDADVIDRLIEKSDRSSMALSREQQEVLRPVFASQLPTEDQQVHYNLTFEPMDEKQPPVMITRGEFMRRMKDMAAMGGPMSFYGEMPDSYNVVVNGNHPLVAEILDEVEKSSGDGLKKMNTQIGAVESEQASLSELLKDKKEDDLTPEEKTQREEIENRLSALRGERDQKLEAVGHDNKLVKQVVDLALLSNGMLRGEDLTEFIRRSVELIGSGTPAEEKVAPAPKKAPAKKK